MINFFISLILFSLTNMIDYGLGQGNPKYYPLLVYLIFTFVVSTFLYRGWLFAYVVNALQLYSLSIYSIFHHPESHSPLSRLLGTLPLSPDGLIVVSLVFLVSLLIQFAIFKYSHNREDEP